MISTQEAEVERITVQGQPGLFSKSLSQSWGEGENSPSLAFLPRSPQLTSTKMWGLTSVVVLCIRGKRGLLHFVVAKYVRRTEKEIMMAHAISSVQTLTSPPSDPSGIYSCLQWKTTLSCPGLDPSPVLLTLTS